MAAVAEQLLLAAAAAAMIEEIENIGNAGVDGQSHL